MVKFILAEEVLPLRSLVLRNRQPQEQCVFPTDQVKNAFHLGFFLAEKLISVASFLPNSKFENKERGYQLRGMATDPEYGGKGYGSALIFFAIDHLQKLDVDYLWCNARSTAASFYKKSGFTIVSAEFDIAGIGNHYEMKLNLTKN